MYIKLPQDNMPRVIYTNFLNRKTRKFIASFLAHYYSNVAAQSFELSAITPQKSAQRFLSVEPVL